ncbi:MAG: CPBP family intramembrane glutamic endopeptidase, partial [Candidatus Dormiibacterota bacterium]
MIQVRLAAPRRAARVTGLVLGAALLRALLLPAGDGFSTIVFGGCLLAISWFERGAPTLPSPTGGGNLTGAWGRGRAIVAGLMVGAILLAPVVTGPLGGRPWSAFWSWAVIAAAIATLEETSIRGVLYRRWTEEGGTVAAIVVGAAVFALIHLPRYGLGAMPLDAAVGLALGGLRALTGRVLPCVVAHTVADWGAWFWA